MTDIWKTFNTSNFDRFFVGADKLAKNLTDNATYLAANFTNYPPFNLSKVSENQYLIELAVAGFSTQNVELTLEDNKLTIKGSVKVDDSKAENYLYKGIADRNFTRCFTLADNVEINNAEMINGLLKIWLEHIIPESKKPRTIEINAVSEVTKKKKSDSQ
mgnify:CR=1 FL=1|jgi:molecular chaperone IbpA